MTESQSAKPPEPYGYGNEFTSVEEFMGVVRERQEQGLQLYGHAVIYIPSSEKYPKRIAARVGFNGDIMFDAHCENI